MKIRHIRNATALLTLGAHHLLVDPMLADVGALPGFKLFGGGRRPNPLVPLPADTLDALAAVTGVLITHEHPDHLDRAGIRWIRSRGLPVWASPMDAANLRKKGLDVHELGDGALGLNVEIVPTKHGRGPLAWMMGPVSGCYLAHPDEPGVYFTSDAVLTDAILDAIDRLRPEVVVAPAGAANMGAGGDILFSVDELVTLVRRAPGQVVLNHLEALDHCPTTRRALRERMRAEGLLARVHIPEDGETLHFDGPPAPRPARPQPAPGRRPGFQKWVTAHFTMT
jgi:L-ascorbate metabolism protein UlaG (beta-lactamase superfamily)